MLLLYGLGILVMIVTPLALGSWLARRRQADWGLFGIGVATFVFSQMLHIPFNLLVERSGLLPTDLSILANLIVVSLFLGLSAGAFEEVARYLGFRFWARDARHWRAGLMLGAGHGGIEALILGLFAMVNTAALFGIREGYFEALVPPEQMPLVQAQVHSLLDAAWYDALLAPAERLFALTAHLALSLLVMESLIRQRARWLGAAIIWHALLDALAVFCTVRWNIYVAEGIVALFALASAIIIVRLRRREMAIEMSVPESLPPVDVPDDVKRDNVELNKEKLEQSRFY